MLKTRRTWFLWFLLLAIPGSGFLRFDGLPFSSKTEFVVILISFCSLLSSEFRSRFKTSLSSNSGQTKRWIDTVLLAAIILKFFTFTLEPLGNGFESCYRSIYAPAKETKCERSYEAPFLEADQILNMDQITRMESQINFGPSGNWVLGGASATTWRLPFVNEFPRFEALWLDRLPFTAKFGSLIEARRDSLIPVQFVGEVSVTINDQVTTASSYTQPMILLIPIQKGTSKFILDFKFADLEIAEIPDRQPPIKGPWAQLFVGRPMSKKFAASDMTLNLSGWSVDLARNRVPKTYEIRSDTGEVLASVEPIKREDVGKAFSNPKFIDSGFNFSIPKIDQKDSDYKVELFVVYLDGSETSLGKLGHVSKNSPDISTVEITQQSRVSQTNFDTAWFSLDTKKTPVLKPKASENSLKVASLLRALDTFVLIGTFIILMTLTIALGSRLKGAAQFLVSVFALKWALDYLPFDWWGFKSTVLPISVALLIGISLRRKETLSLGGVALGVLVIIFEPMLDLARRFMGLADAEWWGFHLFRGRGSDWVVNQGYARRIFLDTSLNAGESIFYFQPATRYMVFIQNILFGENDILSGLILKVGLLTVVVFAARATMTYSSSRQDKNLTTLFTVACFAIFSDQLFLGFAFAPSSEYPTWICIFIIFGLTLRGKLSQPLAIGATIIAGLTAQFRPNQAFGALLLFLLIQANLNVQKDNRMVLERIQLIFVFAMTMSLSLLHNLHYGFEFVLFSNTGPLNSDFPYSSLLNIFSDQSAREMFLAKLSTYFNYKFPQSPLTISFWALDLLWLIAVIRTVATKKVKFNTWIVLIFPLAYIVPQFPYNILSYYPRHIVATHLAFGLSALYVYSRLSGTHSNTAATDHSQGDVGHVRADAVNLPLN